MLIHIYQIWFKSSLVFMFFGEIYCLQRFIEFPEYTEVNPGQDALLKCRILDKRGSCSWQKDNKPVGTHKNKYEWANADSPSGDCSLWVRQATLQLDDGQWQCQVTASSFDVPDALSSAPAALAVRVAPQAPKILFNGSGLMPGENITVQAGTRATIVCEARYGNPPAAISWFMDKEPLSAWSQTNTSEVERPRVWASRSVLELGAARGTHGRTLACRAAHASYPLPGYRDAYALLDVTYVPVVSILGTDSGLTKLEEGSGVVSLECRADGNPKPYIWWTKDGQIIQSTGTKLILAPISRNHSGIYSCQARNNLGSSEPVKVEIDVKYPPRVIWVGPDMVVEANLFSRVVLECKAEGNPKPHYQWLHSPHGVHQDKSSLPTGYVVSNDAQFILPNVTYKQQGLYYCVAVNHIAFKERSHQADPVTLNVIGPPLGLDNEGVDGWLGRDVEIYVDVCADPPPRKATWLWGSLRLNVPSTVGRYRSADMINEGGCFRYNLFIQETIKQDARIYILQVENERGSTTHAVTLTLHETAKIAPLVGIVFLAAAILVVIICLLRRCRHKKETVQYKAPDLEPEKTEAIPADAIYSAKAYSPDALKDAYSTLANNAKENIYAVLDPHVQYDLTISRHGSPPTHLSLRRPLQQPSEQQTRKSQRSSGSRKSRRRARKPRPKSLLAFDSPRYLDHVFPDGVEL